MEEMSARAGRTGRDQYSYFLSPAEQMQAEISAKKQGCHVSLWGGFPGAERKIAVFHSEDTVPDWPIDVIRFSWNERFGSIAHKDLLGALMSLGMDRERYGDILISQGCAYAVVHRGIAEFVAGAIQKAGRVTVAGTIADGIPVDPTLDGEEIRLVVPSLRLDAIISAAWKMSRARAQEVVASGKVQVDYCPELRPDHMIGESALISVRGLGRLKIIEMIGKTKKNKICILLTRY